ncbi:hypothetical protein EYF80_028658 [Liparis tanakae]|uniref:Uncharacterized protein n=1 Tax=Liparis tanakae TaxID=230148 RepID=A0A4Z2H6K8_9TELE|nr:hypothetical protein EYF80_028658 [Liparis tanakae]
MSSRDKATMVDCEADGRDSNGGCGAAENHSSFSVTMETTEELAMDCEVEVTAGDSPVQGENFGEDDEHICLETDSPNSQGKTVALGEILPEMPSGTMEIDTPDCSETMQTVFMRMKNIVRSRRYQKKMLSEKNSLSQSSTLNQIRNKIRNQIDTPSQNKTLNPSKTLNQSNTMSKTMRKRNILSWGNTPSQNKTPNHPSTLSLRNTLSQNKTLKHLSTLSLRNTLSQNKTPNHPSTLTLRNTQKKSYTKTLRIMSFVLKMIVIKMWQ